MSQNFRFSFIFPFCQVLTNLSALQLWTMLSIHFKLLYEDIIIKSSNIFTEWIDRVKVTLYGAMFRNHWINITLLKCCLALDIFFTWQHFSLKCLLSGVPVFLFFYFTASLQTWGLSASIWEIADLQPFPCYTMEETNHNDNAEENRKHLDPKLRMSAIAKTSFKPVLSDTLGHNLLRLGIQLGNNSGEVVIHKYHHSEFPAPASQDILILWIKDIWILWIIQVVTPRNVAK